VYAKRECIYITKWDIGMGVCKGESILNKICVKMSDGEFV
jgi:hypothetical protein